VHVSVFIAKTSAPEWQILLGLRRHDTAWKCLSTHFEAQVHYTVTHRQMLKSISQYYKSQIQATVDSSDNYRQQFCSISAYRTNNCNPVSL